MTTLYKIEGMTCNGCVANVKQKLESFDGIESVNVQLQYPQATIKSSFELDHIQLDNIIGKYKLTPAKEKIESPPTTEKDSSIQTYKPLILIVAFLLGITLLIQYPFNDFSISTWMRHFMAGFFLAFSFFKFLNISGFASSFSMYDVVAKKWYNYGYIYPFLELALGVAYLINLNSNFTNIGTIVLLGTGSIGVIQSNLSKQKIQCACLGDIFDLPMSKVTIFENTVMILMAIIMLINS